MHIYVASSWRNLFQPLVVDILRESADAHVVYDFRHPPGGDHLGFSWDEVDPDWRTWNRAEFLAALEHPVAQAGFRSDYDAMLEADMGVLVLPSGRSSHLEAGYFVGAGKPLLILIPDRSQFEHPPTSDTEALPEAELMYAMADGIALSVAELIAGVGALQRHWEVAGRPRGGWRDRIAADADPAWYEAMSLGPNGPKPADGS